MNKILALAMLLLLSTPVVNAEVPEVDINYFGEVMTLMGHKGSISDVDWSPDGTKIVSSDWDKNIKIWNATDGKLLYNLSDDVREVANVKWSPDGTKIASSHWDQTVRIWDALTYTELAVYNQTTSPWGLDWSPDSTKILVGSIFGELTLWEVSTGNPVLNLTSNHSEYITAIEWSPDGTMISTGSFGNRIIIWNATSFQIIEIYDYLLNGTFNPDDVSAISWSPDSSRIAVGGDIGNLAIINVFNGSRKDIQNYNNAIWDVSWSPSGTKIATSMDDFNVVIWDLNGNILRTMVKSSIQDHYAISWSPDETKIASGDGDIVEIWGDLRDVISEQKETIQEQQNIISVQNENIQQQQDTLNNISFDITRFEQDMQATFENPNFTLAGSTPDEKVKTLVDVLIQLSRGAKNEIYKLLGYK